VDGHRLDTLAVNLAVAPNPHLPSIPQPNADLGSLQVVAQALKQRVENLDGFIATLSIPAAAAGPATAVGYVLPTASVTQLGGVKVDGVTVKVISGVLSAVEPGVDTSRYAASNPAGYQTAGQVLTAIGAHAYTLPMASRAALGGVRVDGTTVVLSGVGVISVVYGTTGTTAAAGNDTRITGAQTAAQVATAISGEVTARNTAIGVETARALVAEAALVYTLPPATNLVRGGIKVDGTTVTMAGDVLSAVVGGAGTVLSISGSGGTTGLTLAGGPITTSGTLTLGGTLGLANGGTGAITAPLARTALGLATVAATGAYADLSGAPATYSLPTATPTVLGGVKPDGTTIANTAGAISVAYGTTGTTAAVGNDGRITGAQTAAQVATAVAAEATARNAAIAAAAYVLPTASPTVLGGVKVDGTTITIAAGVIAAAAAGLSAPVLSRIWFSG
jgi:hypothetical protein